MTQEMTDKARAEGQKGADIQQLPPFLRFVVMLARGPVFGASVSIHGTIRSAWSWLTQTRHASYGLAVTRILVGITGFGLLLTNFRTRLYSFGSGAAWNGEMAGAVSDFPKIWVFSAFHSVMANNVGYSLLYVLLALLALLVAFGWRFHAVLPVYFVLWVGFIEANDMLGDQGDNMYRIILLLLFFTDASGRWSLDEKRREKHGMRMERVTSSELLILIHNCALIALAAQVILVYTSGALFKAGGTPWAEGWAIYHPLATARFGTWPLLSEVLTAWGPLVAFGTLGSVFVQAAFPFLLLNRRTRVFGLVAILGFHLAIALLMGLPWFSLTMIAVDSIFIRDQTWISMKQNVRSAWRVTHVTTK